jgi:hypothetical protein
LDQSCDFENFIAEKWKKWHFRVQGCQMFLGKIYQKGENISNDHNIGIPNGYKIYQNSHYPFQGPKYTQIEIWI